MPSAVEFDLVTGVRVPDLHRDQGAESVIGFVLIFGIALAAITVVLLGGTPVLDKVQSEQETDSLARFMNDLDTEISGLISGAPAGATPVWRVSMARGDLHLEDGHVWAYAIDQDDDAGAGRSLGYAGFHGGTTTFTIVNEGAALADLRATGLLWDGSGSTPVTVTVPSSLGAGASATVTLSQAMERRSIEVQFYEGASSVIPFARVWLVDAGAVVWEISAGGALKEVTYQNTGVIHRQGDAMAFVNDPRVRPPVERSSDVDDVFLRIVNLNGNVEVSGRSSTEVLLSSGGNHARFTGSEVNRVQIYPSEQHDAAWVRLLDSDELGYTFTVDSVGSGADEAERATYAPSGGKTLATGFVETPVQLEVVARR